MSTTSPKRTTPLAAEATSTNGVSTAADAASSAPAELVSFEHEDADRQRRFMDGVRHAPGRRGEAGPR